MSSMRITMIGSLPPIKGMSAYCLQLVQALSKKIKVDFINFVHIYPPIIYPIAPKEDDRVFKPEYNENVTQRVKLRWYHPLGAIIEGIKIKNEIVHFHWWTSFLFIVFFPVVFTAKIRKKKIVCTVHNVLGHESNLFDYLICKIILKLPDRYIVHTENNKKRLIDIFHIASDKVEVIPHGRYDFYIEKSITRAEAKKKLGIGKNDKVILFFGQIREYKGIDTLLLALARIKDAIPNVKCILGGKNWVPWDRYQKIIDEKQLQEIVIADRDYVPSSQVQYLYSAADVVVLPYKKFESQSGPGNIALGFNRALVVSNVGGLPDLVKDQNVVFEPENAEELSRILKKILSDEEYQRLLEDDSRELAQKYDWNIIAEKTIQLYRSLELNGKS